MTVKINKENQIYKLIEGIIEKTYPKYNLVYDTEWIDFSTRIEYKLYKVDWFLFKTEICSVTKLINWLPTDKKAYRISINEKYIKLEDIISKLEEVSKEYDVDFEVGV